MIGEVSDRITLPTDMKNLSRQCQCESPLAKEEMVTYPNVAPDAPMNWPKVLIMPFGPAPYLKMLTVPAKKEHMIRNTLQSLHRVALTVDEADDDSNSCEPHLVRDYQ